jgi:hypothetical protein
MSKLGRYLVEEGLISESERRTILRESKGLHSAVAKSVLALGVLDEDELTALLAARTPFKVAPKNIFEDIDETAVSMLPEGVATFFEVIALRFEGDTLFVAMLDPTDQEVKEQLAFFTGLRIRPVIASLAGIRKALRRFYPTFVPQQSSFEKFLQHHSSPAARVALGEIVTKPKKAAPVLAPSPPMVVSAEKTIIADTIPVLSDTGAIEIAALEPELNAEGAQSADEGMMQEPEVTHVETSQEAKNDEDDSLDLSNMLFSDKVEIKADDEAPPEEHPADPPTEESPEQLPEMTMMEELAVDSLESQADLADVGSTPIEVANEESLDVLDIDESASPLELEDANALEALPDMDSINIDSNESSIETEPQILTVDNVGADQPPKDDDVLQAPSATWAPILNRAIVSIALAGDLTTAISKASQALAKTTESGILFSSVAKKAWQNGELMDFSGSVEAQASAEWSDSFNVDLNGSILKTGFSLEHQGQSIGVVLDGDMISEGLKASVAELIKSLHLKLSNG